MLSLLRRAPALSSGATRSLPKPTLLARIARLHISIPRLKRPAPTPLIQTISNPRRLSHAVPRTSAAAYSVHATDIARSRHNHIAELIPSDRKINLREILNDLRDLELLDKFRGDAGKSGTGYKDAARMLYPLLRENASKPSSAPAWITFGELHDALPASYTLPWGSIHTRLVQGTVPDKLAALDEEDLTCLRFMRISGVGPSFARRFYDAKCRTFDDLKKKDGVEDSGIKLTKAQRVNLELLEESEMLVPRKEMDQLKKVLISAAKKADPDYEGEILGSYRRGVAFSSDIDLAVRHPDYTAEEPVDAESLTEDDKKALAKADAAKSKAILKKLIDVLMKKGLIKQSTQLTNGAKKWSGWITLPAEGSTPRRIDIRLAPRNAYPYMLLGSTGDAMLMKLLRSRAKNMGWCLNEYGMGDKYAKEDENPNGFKPGTLKVVEDEAAIFKLLKLPELKPTEREQSTWEPIFRKAGVKLDHLHKL